MTRIIEFLIALAITAALFLVVALVLPSQRNLQEKIETNRKLTIVYDTLNSLRRFKDWNPLVLRDPKVQLRYSGPASGVGARMDYKSDVTGIGAGSWEIKETESGKRVAYALENPDRGSNKKMQFSFRPTGQNNRNVEITQAYHVEYGFDLLGRYAGLYVSRHVGDDMKIGLQRLANMFASVPNVDYAAMQTAAGGMTAPRLVDVPAEDLLFVSAGTIDKKPEALMAAMRSNLEWINRTIAANGLSSAGPMRIVSTEVATDTYTFDVAVPVRRGAAAKPVASPASAAAPAPAPAPVASTGPLTGLKMQGPVKYVHADAGKAITAGYTGFMFGVENVRNALRAWASTQGIEATDRPYEVYRGSIDEAFTEKGKFDVFWKIKQ